MMQTARAPQPSGDEATVSIEMGGRTFSLAFPTAADHIARIIRNTKGFYEPEMLADAQSRLFFPSQAVDVGAHVGNHTLFFAGVLGMATIAFEPNPTHFALLKSNVEANGLSQLCRLNPSAVGAGRGWGHAVDGGSGNSGMARIESSQAGDIPIVTLDETIPDIERIDVLKIDVEGSEIGVLSGAERLLTRCRPLIYVEIGAANFARVRSYLSGLRYVCWRRFNATPTFLFMPAERFAL